MSTLLPPRPLCSTQRASANQDSLTEVQESTKPESDTESDSDGWSREEKVVLNATMKAEETLWRRVADLFRRTPPEPLSPHWGPDDSGSLE